MAGTNPIGSSDYSWLFGIQQTQKQDSISQAWESYSNYQSNATSALSGLTEINANFKAVLASYAEAKSAFNTEFEENMSALSESAKEVAKYSFAVQKDGAITKTETTDENGVITSKTIYSKDLQSALNVVNDFVSNYNSSLQFLSDNAPVSKRVENLYNNFNDAGYRASNYQSIGLNVTSNGMLEVNEEMLANAIVNNPDKVSSVLGSDGLAGKVESHVSFANAQQENLFPTVEDMFGDEISAVSLYNSKAYLSMANYATVGNFLNMLF